MLLTVSGDDALADTLKTNSLESFYGNSLLMASPEKDEKGVRDPITGWHLYWENGYISVDNRQENIRFRINGKVIVDTGEINADDELQQAFPDLEGRYIRARNVILSTHANFYDAFDFKIGVDFANIKDIKDIWFRYLKNSWTKKITVGHMKEPFSLEYLTSTSRISFMERSLPDEAFGTGRNIGIRYDSMAPEAKLNAGLGVFLNTGSFSDIGEAKDQITQSNGFDTTARIFSMPFSTKNLEKLLHLGLGGSIGFRVDDDSDLVVRFRARPESRLTDERLVDTGPISGKRRDKVNAEMAAIFGPISAQAQCYYLTTDTSTSENLGFWGYYAFLSYFITGEHRKYNPSLGIFSGVEPQPVFQPSKGMWGAWELALRHSYVDLNDDDIQGGRESNITAGLNWINNRNVRFMFNYINAHVKDRGEPTVEDGTAHIFQARFEVIW